MSKAQAPTPEELKKAKKAVDEFDRAVQSSEVFNEPLTKGERALITTFYLFLQRQQPESVPEQ